MRNDLTARGFELIVHDVYAAEPAGVSRLVQQSSAIGGYDDAFGRPGSSFLWVGDEHHLNREEVAKLRDALTQWLETGHLFTGNSEEP